MDQSFGEFVRQRRMAKASVDPRFSVRQLARRTEIEHSYLSEIERGKQPPPGEKTIRRIATELGEDSDVLLALAKKVPSDLVRIIGEHPQEIGKLLRSIDEGTLRFVCPRCTNAYRADVDFLVSDAENGPLYAIEVKSRAPSKREHFKVSAQPGSGKTHAFVVSQVTSGLGKRKKTMTSAALEARKNAPKKSARYSETFGKREGNPNQKEAKH